MDVSTADIAGKLKVIASAAVPDGSLFYKYLPRQLAASFHASHPRCRF
jgi:hypothetical protein